MLRLCRTKTFFTSWFIPLLRCGTVVGPLPQKQSPRLKQGSLEGGAPYPRKVFFSSNGCFNPRMVYGSNTSNKNRLYNSYTHTPKHVYDIYIYIVACMINIDRPFLLAFDKQTFMSYSLKHIINNHKLWSILYGLLSSQFWPLLLQLLSMILS